MSNVVAMNVEHVSCKLHSRQIRGAANFSGLSEVFAGLRSPSILGGNSAKADAGRFSYWVAEPKEIFEFRTGEHEPFEKLQKILDKYTLLQDAGTKLPEGIFCGGWIGYFSYELGRYIEKLPETTVDDLQMPLIRLCFYDRLIAYDHIADTSWLIVLQLPNDTENLENKLADLEELLEQSKETFVPQPVNVDLDSMDFSSVQCNVNKEYYLRTVEKIKRYIFDGEVYQINFSQRFESNYKARPIDLYHWQNRYNPSGYAAFIDGGDFQIVSASPEMFLTISDGVIQTKPIKGTRRRVNETSVANLEIEQINADNFDELLNSEKERAELNMIIDLERNDVAKICRPGTRTVIQPRTIETYPTVFHAVATIAGQLRDDVTICDVLKAMFPGGSITGAPKIRSMEIIDETEPTARSVYTGSIGFIGIDGNACLNIAIRTIIIKGERAFVQAGGGIVADSDPEAEWQETITKARALIAGIQSVVCNTHDAIRHNGRKSLSQ